MSALQKAFYGENLDGVYTEAYDKAYDAALGDDVCDFLATIPRDDREDLLAEIVLELGKKQTYVQQAFAIHKAVLPYVRMFAESKADNALGHAYDRRAA